MKPVKILWCAALAGAMALAASQARAITPVFPLVKLSISGTIEYSVDTTATHAGVETGSPLLTVTLSVQELINLLNASPTFTNALTNQFGSALTNRIPAGSYFLWDIESKNLIITNANGFSFNLRANNSAISFGYILIDDEELYGTFTQNNTTHAGSETDHTDIFFYFSDHNGDEIQGYGQATLTWTYAATSTASQKTTLSVSMSGNGYEAMLNGHDGLPIFTATGSGTAMDPIGQNPFYQWDD